MNRPWQTWLAFSVCALVAIAALGWLTHHAVRADLHRGQARMQADLEQRVSLVLWRMDTKLTPLIAEEVARPPSFYQAAIAENPSDVQQQALPVISAPSTRKNVFLNFDVGIDGTWRSPQVPDGVAASANFTEQFSESRQRLRRLADEVSVVELIDRLPEQPLPTVELSSKPTSDKDFFAFNRVPIQSPMSKSRKRQGKGLQDRGQRYQDIAQQELLKQRGSHSNEQQTGRTEVRESVSRPVWVGDHLLLARRVVVNGGMVVQGSWLDWQQIMAELLAEAVDQLPNASLNPAYDPEHENPMRMLAGLPVVLDPGEKLFTASISDSMRWALLAGWAALLFAVAAVAGLLWGVIALSERRAAFVSSVTHELRTPLTTFRMYSDMLARGMVPDATRRQEYLETLRREADRLTHLVENVLSYARLERGRGISSCEQVTVRQLVERLQPRLSERAEQEKMRLELTMSEEVGSVELTTDVSVVEQILFNLVDNAAKYAVGAEDRRIRWGADVVGNYVRFTVSDHGPGFANTRRPKEFRKTSEVAAASAPGVGLGLALSRRLARQLDGRLEICSTGEGAAVKLKLPSSVKEQRSDK